MQSLLQRPGHIGRHCSSNAAKQRTYAATRVAGRTHPTPQQLHQSHTLPLQQHAFRAAATTSQAEASSDISSSTRLDKGPVLVVPAFYLDASVFRPLVKELRSRGFNAALPPVRWTDWVPTLGGRSVRPILDRMDYALTQLLEGYEVSEDSGFEVKLPRPATYQEWLVEFRDASRGAQPPIELTGPYSGSQRAAIVASSAAGWISRIFLGRGPPYSNTVYHGADRVHTLVTLGTPHTSAEPVTRRNIDYVNENYGALDDVRYVAIGSKTVQGKSYLNGRVQDFAYQSYNICCGNGSVWGDGVTPLECALALDGAQHIVFEGARHVPLEAKPDQNVHWYGSGEYLERWVHYLEQPGSAAAAAATGGESAAVGSSSSGGGS